MADQEKEIRKFLDDICVELGFCLPLEEIEKLASREFYEADQFVRDIFIIEGLSPDLELHLFREVKRKFTDQHGSRLGRFA